MGADVCSLDRLVYMVWSRAQNRDFRALGVGSLVWYWVTNVMVLWSVRTLVVLNGWPRSSFLSASMWSSVMHVRLLVGSGYVGSLKCTWLSAWFRSPRTAMVYVGWSGSRTQALILMGLISLLMSWPWITG